MELYREDIAVAAIDQEGVDRVTAAQAADELLRRIYALGEESA